MRVRSSGNTSIWIRRVTAFQDRVPVTFTGQKRQLQTGPILCDGRIPQSCFPQQSRLLSNARDSRSVVGTAVQRGEALRTLLGAFEIGEPSCDDRSVSARVIARAAKVQSGL